MSTPSDPLSASLRTKEERLAALSPEDRRRIGTAMRFLVDLKAIYLEGMGIGSDLLEGKAPAEDVGMRLVELERNLRLASNDMLKLPLRVVHADALRTRQTKLDEEPWLMRVRIRASEARKVREEQAREERMRASYAKAEVEDAEEEPEEAAGMRP